MPAQALIRVIFWTTVIVLVAWKLHQLNRQARQRGLYRSTYGPVRQYANGDPRRWATKLDTHPNRHEPGYHLPGTPWTYRCRDCHAEWHTFTTFDATGQGLPDWLHEHALAHGWRQPTYREDEARRTRAWRTLQRQHLNR